MQVISHTYNSSAIQRPIWIWLYPWHNLRFTHTNISPATRGLHYDWNYQWLPMTLWSNIVDIVGETTRYALMNWSMRVLEKKNIQFMFNELELRPSVALFTWLSGDSKYKHSSTGNAAKKSLMNSSASSVEDNFTNHTLRSRDGVSQLRIHLEQRPQLWRQWKASNALIQDLGFRVWVTLNCLRRHSALRTLLCIIYAWR